MARASPARPSVAPPPLLAGPPRLELALLPALLAAVMVLGASDPTDGPSGIWSYLGPRFGSDRPYWHGALFVQSANHYLSSPYLLTMLCALALALALGLLQAARASGIQGIVVRLTVAILLAAITWDRSRVAFAIGALLALALVLQAPSNGPARHSGCASP